MVRKSLVKGEMDRRIIEQKLRNREISEGELKKVLATLPDSADNAEFVAISREVTRRRNGRSDPHAD